MTIFVEPERTNAPDRTKIFTIIDTFDLVDGLQRIEF